MYIYIYIYYYVTINKNGKQKKAFHHIYKINSVPPIKRYTSRISIYIRYI